MKLFIGSIIAVTLFLSCISTATNDQESKVFKKEFLSLINKARHEGCNCGNVYMPPAPPLVWNDELEVAAQNHAQDMSDKNYFSHDSKDGRSATDRVIAAGYTYKGFKSFAAGENIAQGQMTIAEVMAGWLKSPGHCKNLLNPSFKEIGVAQFNRYWVQDFGGREEFSPEMQKLIKSGKYKLIQKAPSSH
jgi:uncharacterized protein YkwD